MDVLVAVGDQFLDVLHEQRQVGAVGPVGVRRYEKQIARQARDEYDEHDAISTLPVGQL